MADNEIDAVTPGSGASKNSGPGMGKLLVVSLLASLVMSGGVGAGLYFVLQPQIAAQQAGDPDAPEAPQKSKKPPIYFSLDEPFIVNLSSQGTRFLQVTVEIMAREDAVIEAVQKHRPLLRNNLLLLFSAQTPSSIGSPEGKEELRRSALSELQSILTNLGEPAEVEDLYFTSLVVQ
ncbi:flagellar basal body-associated FliL family protein [Chromatocurvus halotolerans]|uniref:Flagellar protein FliL n=1 Tax=Chromatocurvus halotolerans TaxID=1132028 RepID=A0A4R2KZ01_9GAMM|nr:flagellar basal body-associated FliL family protein [Chromatocurvus halotolerans]TCO76596.1 flagellar FliL protein [Chromatocurvus halotolerans]